MPESMFRIAKKISGRSILICAGLLSVFFVWSGVARGAEPSVYKRRSVVRKPAANSSTTSTTTGTTRSAVNSGRNLRNSQRPVRRQIPAPTPQPPTAPSPTPTPSTAKQKTTLLTLHDGIIVYSAPGKNYRPLIILSDKTSLLASPNIVKGRRGDFYKVLVLLGPKQKAIGYIPTAAEVKLVTSSTDTNDNDNEDIEKYGPIALVNQAIQISYSRFINSESEWSVGYMKYISPGFYVKGLVGEFIALDSSGTLAGFEVGNDALLFKSISMQLSYSAGFFTPAQYDGVFIGSKAVNGFAQGIVALRYNFRGLASASIGGTQIALVNANNSFVTYGANVTVEIGL